MHETNRYNHFIHHSNLVHEQKERNTPSGHLDDLAINLTKIYIQDHWFKKLYIGIKFVGSLFRIMKNFTWDQYFYMGSVLLHGISKINVGISIPNDPCRDHPPPPRSQCKLAILLLWLHKNCLKIILDTDFISISFSPLSYLLSIHMLQLKNLLVALS